MKKTVQVWTGNVYKKLLDKFGVDLMKRMSTNCPSCKIKDEEIAIRKSEFSEYKTLISEQYDNPEGGMNALLRSKQQRINRLEEANRRLEFENENTFYRSDLATWAENMEARLKNCQDSYPLSWLIEELRNDWNLNFHNPMYDEGK